MKLYLVKCKGMTATIGSQTAHGIAYVVANNSEEAYKMLRNKLDGNDLGFRHERELDTIQLIAEEGNYPDCGIVLLRKAQEK